MKYPIFLGLTIMYMYEIMDMKIEGLKSYFSSPWNYLDQLAPVLFGMFFYIDHYANIAKENSLEYRIENNWSAFYTSLIFMRMYVKLSWF